MAKNNSRSKRDSLLKGATEGRYVEARRDVEIAPGTGENLTNANRALLMKDNGFGLMGDLSAHGAHGRKPVPGTW
jgi:hypothetical protein